MVMVMMFYMDILVKNLLVLGNSEVLIGKNVFWNWGRSYCFDFEVNNYINLDGIRIDRGVGFFVNNDLGWGRGRVGFFFWNIY